MSAAKSSFRCPVAMLILTLLIALFAATGKGWDLTEFRSPKDFKEFQDFVNGDTKDGPEYTDVWLVNIEGGPLTAAIVAKELGYQNLGKVPSFDNFYLMKDTGRATGKQKRAGGHRMTQDLQQHAKVVWAEQQVSKRREKRDLIPLDPPINSRAEGNRHSPDSTLAVADDNGGRRVKRKAGQHRSPGPKGRRFNDELWDHEWYLQDTRTLDYLPELDLHVLPVYDMGITGKGVKITVLDDGLEYNHTDIARNYDPTISYDANDRDNDPFPRYDEIDTNSHGTRCAGEIAMVANNGKCGVGVAHSASIGGIRMLDGIVTDAVEGMSLGFNVENIDIYSSSWGPADDGRTVEGPGELTMRAFHNGVTKGRHGKGSIYVWAAGNGGHRGDSCACDGYASSPYTVSIGSASQSGKFPWYGERCGSTLATTYSSGAYKDQKITTTDLHDSCTVDHTGTSAAAPLAAGIIALVLEANPSLTWRDVQHLIVTTSDYRPLFENAGWSINAAGLMFNPRFGFGLMNAHAMVKAALNWTNVPPQATCQHRVQTDGDLLLSNTCETSVTYELTSCESERKLPVVSLEHVEVTVNVRYPRRGSLMIHLVSPAGTSSEILNPRENDNSSAGFKEWSFMSVHFWGEDPRGNWTVVISDTDDDQAYELPDDEATDLETQKHWRRWAASGKVNKEREGTWGPVTFKFYGTEERPVGLKPRYELEQIKAMRQKLEELNALEAEKERSQLLSDDQIDEIVAGNPDDIDAPVPLSGESADTSAAQAKNRIDYPTFDSAPDSSSADDEDFGLALANLLREPRIGDWLLSNDQQPPDIEESWSNEYNGIEDFSQNAPSEYQLEYKLPRPDPLLRLKREKRTEK